MLVTITLLVQHEFIHFMETIVSPCSISILIKSLKWEGGFCEWLTYIYAPRTCGLIVKKSREIPRVKNQCHFAANVSLLDL